jgi:hypothetical protein
MRRLKQLVSVRDLQLEGTQVVLSAQRLKSAELKADRYGAYRCPTP